MPQHNPPPMGLSKLDKGYKVCVWAPHAASVSIHGEFDDWSDDGLALSKEDGGVWAANVPELKNNQQYQFLITTESGDVLKRNDPRARLLTNSVGASIVYDDDYHWPDAPFSMPDKKSLVIYELHIGTFNCKERDENGTPNKPGTFDSAIEKLDYLAELGINCIELMPVNEFAGDFSWGYNPAYPFAVEEAYGGPNGLKDFVREAHARGIAVVLDVVYNHFGPSDLHLWQFDGWSENNKGGIYFYNDWRSDTPWGDTRPDYGRPEVRQYIFDNAMMWLDEYRLDGLRMDMIPYMRSVSGSETHFVHPIRDVLTQPDDENRDIATVQKALTQQYSEDPFRRVIYVESHDEVANGSARLAEEIAPGNVDKDYFARQRSVIAAALTLTAPGIPMLFQGQELLEDLWFDDMDPLDWSREQNFPQLHKAYKALIALRKGSPSLHSNEVTVTHFDKDNGVLAYIRGDNGDDDTNQAGNDKVMMVINFKDQAHDNYEIPNLNKGKWHCIFNWYGGYHDPSDFSFLNDTADEEHNDHEKDDDHEENSDREGNSNAMLYLEAYQVLIFQLNH